MGSKACEKGAEEDPVWTTSSLTFSAVASSASWAVRGAAGTAAGGEGRTWCTLSSESLCGGGFPVALRRVGRENRVVGCPRSQTLPYFYFWC